MNLKILVPTTILAAFLALTAHAIRIDGLFGFLDVHATGPWGLQVIVDLVLGLSMFLVFMVPDAKRHGIPAAPFVVATLTLGSIGALAYFVARGVVTRDAQPTVSA